MLPMAPPAASAPEPLPRGRRFRVEGMDCAACAKTVEKTVVALDGVAAAQVSFGTASLLVEGAATDETVMAAVERAGYRARPASQRRTEAAAPFWRRDTRALSTTASALLLLLAVVSALAGAPREVAEPLYLLSLVVGGWPIARAAVSALRTRALDMNVLMTLAAVGAVAIGAYAEGAWVLVLFAVGTALETFALDRSRRAVEALMELAPTEARIVTDGVERLVPVEDVTVGTQFVVRPGERVALDGTVTGGASSVDQSPITGESVPVDLEAGGEAFAGSLNVNGTLTVRASEPAERSTLSRIAGLVEEAQGSHAPVERYIDRFARVYTPIVFAVALLLATMPPLLFSGEWHTWLYRALALLIVACPCSLVISVPVAVVSAIGRAARDGVLIKGGQALEQLARVRAVAIDKTGTLTTGTPRLTSVTALDGLGEDRALSLMASLEQHSEHPLARAIVRAARERGVPIAAADEFAALAGRGAEGRVDGHRLWAGGPRLIRERTGALAPELDALHARGETAVGLGAEGELLAVFGLADEPRREATAALAALRRAGAERIVMLTGDSEPVARAVAAQTGVTEWRAGLLPAEKLDAVRELERDYGAVAMVGDGINDAPALAAARVGVAMGAAGSDVALLSADVALMSDRLDRLAGAFGLSRRALGIMRANVIASLLVKGLFVLLAPFGLVSLVLAVAADMGMSLLVTLNALRLLRRRDAAIMPAASPAQEACTDACCSPSLDAASRPNVEGRDR